MALCGSICFSGFYSDDFTVGGAERGRRRTTDVLSGSHTLRTRGGGGVFCPTGGDMA